MPLGDEVASQKGSSRPLEADEVPQSDTTATVMPVPGHRQNLIVARRARGGCNRLGILVV